MFNDSRRSTRLRMGDVAPKMTVGPKNGFLSALSQRSIQVAGLIHSSKAKSVADAFLLCWVELVKRLFLFFRVI